MPKRPIWLFAALTVVAICTTLLPPSTTLASAGTVAAPVHEGPPMPALAADQAGLVPTLPPPVLAEESEAGQPCEAQAQSTVVMDPPLGRGFVPPPMDLSHLTGQHVGGTVQRLQGGGMLQSPPSSWDWRTQGKVTPVQNQGPCGSCYAFASVANVEARLLVGGESAYDLSENNAKECNWDELNNVYGGTSCSGGNYDLLANLFSQKGTVLESCDPYVASDVGCSSTCPYQKTLLDWRIISGSAVPDTDVLKSYIQTYGPVYTTLYASFPGFSSYNGSYTLYYSGTNWPNHAVLIVGWDDSLTHAGGTGGWIVKNSWGTAWGDDGYFTIAYGSANIGMYSSFMYDWQDYDASGNILYYDEAGWATSWGWGDTTAWGLVKFIPPSDTNGTRVEFWTSDETTDVDVYLYDDFDGTRLGNLLTQKLDNQFAEAGYHSVELNSPVPLNGGDDVIVAVKFTNSSYGYPVAADNIGPYETQRTYISHSGASGSWYDLGTYYNDVTIRVRTSSPHVTPTPTPANTPTPTPTPTHTPTPTSMPTPTPMPTDTPTPTPVALTITEIRPAGGFNDALASIDVFGFNFPTDAQASLGTSPATSLPTVFIDDTHLAAKLPAGVTPGTYDLTVEGGGQSDTLTEAYVVLDATQPVDDLRAQPYYLWTDPESPLEGETISLGLVVERVGGTQGLVLVPVRFYLEALNPAAAIGDGYLAGIGVDDTASTTAVDWGAQPAGLYTIFAEIDPDGTVSETNETNNVVSRTVAVWPPLADTTSPVVTDFLVNGGASSTVTRNVTLTVTAIDDTGPAQVYYVEQHYNLGARTWVPVQWTGWLPYNDQPHSWAMHPNTGLRYLQAWAADAAGNISCAPLRAQVNYMPASDQVAAGETKTYRQMVKAGQCLRVRIEPAYGDPDLYVWPPGYQIGDDYWYSIEGAGAANQVQFVAPKDGNYQIEVEGVTEAKYDITVEVGITCSAGTMASVSGDKTPRTQPVVPVDSEPPGQLVVPSPPREPATKYVYLPLILRSHSTPTHTSRIR